MAAGGRNKQAREQRERARAYQARAHYNEGRTRRRTRDNVIGGIVGAVLLVAIAGTQIAFYTAGPGGPSPAPTGTPTPTATSSVVPSPTVTAPSPSPTTTP
ncbi:dioxygenase [Microbacterium sp.]|uniref:dioxygenase n=1 Tax=Microbacterium sp. TaxID=51671 RepID=UPI003A934EE3